MGDIDAQESHSLRIVADAAHGEPEGRVHQHAEEQEDDGQRRQAIEIGGASVEIEREESEHRPDRIAGEPVIAAGDRSRDRRQLAEHGGDRQGQHDQGQPAHAQDDGTGDKTEDAGGGHADQEAGDRLGAEVERIECGGIGAGSEEGRMAQGLDAGEAERQVERQREDDHDDHLGRERQIVAGGQICGDRGKQQERIGPAQAVTLEGAGEPTSLWFPGRKGRGHGRPNRPCGRTNRIDTTAP